MRRTMKRRAGSFWLRGIVMATLALLLAACSGAASETSDLPAEEGVAAGEIDVADISSALPADFPVIFYQDAGLEKGEQVMFSELVAEGKPVVLNFWAGLCPPCRAEMPGFQAVSDEYQDRILMFGLDVGPFVGLGSEESGRALLDELSISYPAGTTSEADVVRQYEVRGMPSTYFIMPDGRLYETWSGLLSSEQLAEIVDEMLAATAES